MTSWDLFESCLPAIEAVTARVCRRARLYGADAEDFASSVRLALMEDDCAILRRHEGRASMEGYLSVIIQRMLADERIRALGRWHPSREATRIGPAAVQLEMLLRRDGKTLDEAFALARGAHPSLTKSDAEQIAARLPQRVPRLREVELEDGVDVASAQTADEHLLEAEDSRVSERASRVVRDTLSAYPLEERMLVRLHHGASMSIADVARMLQLPQRPLYRRIEKIMASLRRALTDAGIDAATLTEKAAQELNFGWSEQTEPARQTLRDEDTERTMP